MRYSSSTGCSAAVPDELLSAVAVDALRFLRACFGSCTVCERSAVVNLEIGHGPDETPDETYSMNVKTGFNFKPDHSAFRRVHCAQVTTACGCQRPVKSNLPPLAVSSRRKLQIRTLYAPGKALYASDCPHDPITSCSIHIFAL